MASVQQSPAMFWCQRSKESLKSEPWPLVIFTAVIACLNDATFE